MNDLDRARKLGMSLDEFQALAGLDPLDTHTEFLTAAAHPPKDKKEQKKKKKKIVEESLGGIEELTEAALHMSLHDEFTDVTGIGDGTTVPFETDEDVRNKTAEELEHYWDHPITTPEDKAMYLGYHIHSKDNVYGLHAHYPGAPLGGGHSHGAQNKLGYHTHRYDLHQLLQFKFARPGVMIQLDGPHIHQQNAPDGKHNHQEENFGPASDRHSEEVAERNSRAD